MGEKTCKDCKNFETICKYVLPSTSAYGCTNFENKNTVFHCITANEEILAEKLVYCNVTVKTILSISREQPGGVELTKKWYSTIIPDKVWENEEEAIATTVAELKKECK